MPPKQHKGKNRPFAGRKNIEARNNALSDAREVKQTYYVTHFYFSLKYLLLSF